MWGSKQNPGTACDHALVRRLDEPEELVKSMALLWQRLRSEATRMAASPAERLADEALEILGSRKQRDYTSRKQVIRYSGGRNREMGTGRHRKGFWVAARGFGRCAYPSAIHQCLSQCRSIVYPPCFGLWWYRRSHCYRVVLLIQEVAERLMAAFTAPGSRPINIFGMAEVPQNPTP